MLKNHSIAGRTSLVVMCWLLGLTAACGGHTTKSTATSTPKATKEAMCAAYATYSAARDSYYRLQDGAGQAHALLSAEGALFGTLTDDFNGDRATVAAVYMQAAAAAPDGDPANAAQTSLLGDALKSAELAHNVTRDFMVNRGPVMLSYAKTQCGG